MISHVIFGVFALLYYLTKLILRAAFGSRRDNRLLLRNAGLTLETLSQQYGGTLQLIGHHGMRWSLHDGSSVEIRRRGHPAIIIDIPIPTQHSLTFQRIPGFVHGFVDTFIPQDSRLGTHPYYINTTDVHNLRLLKERPEFVRLFMRLSKEKYSISLGSSGLRAWKRLGHRETSDVLLYEQFRLLRDFGVLCSSSAAIPVHPINSISRCAYCHEEAAEGLIHCAVCSTPHHQDCFELNGKCSVFGCGSPKRSEEPVFVPS